MKSLNISESEIKFLEEEAEHKYKFFERRYQREHNKKPSAKEKKDFIKNYIRKNALIGDIPLRQAEKEKKQVDILKEIIIRERQRLSVKEMSDILVREGFTSGSSVKTIYRRILGELTKSEAIKKGADGKFFFDENSKRIRFFRDAMDRIENRRQNGLESIKIISSFLELIKDSPVYEKAKDFIKNEEKMLGKRFPKNFDESQTSSRLLFLGPPGKNINIRVWDSIYQAIESNSIINIKYKGEGKKEEIFYTVKSYQLIFDNGLWELWGECISPGHRGRRIFNLSRISSVSIRRLNGKYELPEDFDFLKTLSGNFGCYTDGKQKVYKIKFEKDSYAWLYAKDRIWGDKQSVKTTKDAHLLTFEASQCKPILRWVLGWGGEVEPLEPQELVDAWKEKVNKMFEKIKNKGEK